jgi:AAA domain
MPTLADACRTGGSITLLKGEPGTRKSTCALSYPKPQYWISTDMKMDALEIPAKKWGVDLAKDIKYDDYTDYDKMHAKLKGFQTDCPFKTIVLDSITSIGDVMNIQIIKSKGDAAYKIGNIPIDTIEDYKAEASAFRDIMFRLRDIRKFHKIDIIVIAHVVGQRASNDANKLTHHSRVIVTGGDKIASKIASYCTEAYHFNIKPNVDVDAEGSYALYTVHTGNDYARTSLPLPREITFNDKPLYDGWILPAIKKLAGEGGTTK